MELLEKVKLLYPELGSTKTAKILKVRQSTISKIVSENNIEKNRNNKEKTIKQLSNDLKISNFRIKNIIKN